MSEKKPGGLKIEKGESSLDAIQNRMPHWIHHTQKDERFVGGLIYLRECECSVCGYVAEREMPICPKCKTQIRKI